jgi:hypothetical protein
LIFDLINKKNKMTINLPDDIFNIIDDYSGTKITFKQYKRKKTTNPVIKSIKYKCFQCGKYKNYKQIKIEDDTTAYHICKNNSIFVEDFSGSIVFYVREFKIIDREGVTTYKDWMRRVNLEFKNC